MIIKNFKVRLTAKQLRRIRQQWAKYGNAGSAILSQPRLFDNQPALEFAIMDQAGADAVTQALEQTKVKP